MSNRGVPKARVLSPQNYPRMYNSILVETDAWLRDALLVFALHYVVTLRDYDIGVSFPPDKQLVLTCTASPSGQ